MLGDSASTVQQHGWGWVEGTLLRPRPSSPRTHHYLHIYTHHVLVPQPQA